MIVPAVGRSKGAGRILVMPGHLTASARLPQVRAFNVRRPHLPQVPASRIPQSRIPHSITDVVCTIIVQRGATLQSRSFP